jgi:TorA maturation chaperone TorD
MIVSAAELPGAAQAPSRAHSATEKAAAYALYALAFSAPDDALREVVAEHRGPWSLPAPDPGALVLEHTRLFVGPGRVPAPPYGSVYHDGPVLMGESTMDALRHYREAGFALAPDAAVLPDHVVAELSFLSVLAEEEARAWGEGDAGAARSWMGRRGAFLCDHLAAWAPELCRRMLEATTEPFYVALATRLRDLLATDLQELRAAVADPAPSP